VLHSKFQFKPVIGKSYWLYRRSNMFHLSMIAPQEWGGDGFGQFIGECILQKDITWTLKLDDVATQDGDLMSLLAVKRKEFEKTLNTVDTVDSILPVYVESLPFYQRVFASALANSLRTSMLKSGILGVNYKQAKALIVKKE
jgi:hypothetical protein